jgi:hypothetical protein
MCGLASGILHANGVQPGYSTASPGAGDTAHSLEAKPQSPAIPQKYSRDRSLLRLMGDPRVSAFPSLSSSCCGCLGPMRYAGAMASQPGYHPGILAWMPPLGGVAPESFRDAAPTHPASSGFHPRHMWVLHHYMHTRKHKSL